jgi:hypothetical protein
MKHRRYSSIPSSNANDDNHVEAVAIQFWAILLGLNPENF